MRHRETPFLTCGGVGNENTPQADSHLSDKCLLALTRTHELAERIPISII